MTSSAGQEMKVRMRADLRDAMRGSRPDEARLIRVLVAAIDNAEAPPLVERPASDPTPFVDGSAEIARLSLDHDKVRSILLAEQREREQAAIEMTRLGRLDDAETLRREAVLIERYLT